MSLALTPQAKKILEYARNNGGHISARDASADLDITSAALARRVTEMERRGVTVNRERKKHSVTGKRYTRYHLS